MFASISPKTTRSAEREASSSSLRQSASWHATVDSRKRLSQLDIILPICFFIVYVGDRKDFNEILNYVKFVVMK